MGEARWGARRSCGAARPLGDFPQLVGQRGLALGDGPWGPGGLHVRHFTFAQREGGETKDSSEDKVTDKDLIACVELENVAQHEG